MTPRLPVLAAPAPLEAYASQFDDLFVSRAQRRAFRDYLAGLLLPRDRNKTLTCLAGAEPGVDAQHREVQRLQWFLSDSPWEHERINARRVALLMADPVTAPHGAGALLLDDSGDRKSGHATAHVSRQYIGSRAAIENGIVAVSTAWADERVYYPLHVEPYTPASRLPQERKDPAFRTKGQIAAGLVTAARQAHIPFRAVVADCFYGPSESPGLVAQLQAAGVPFVLALKPNQEFSTPEGGPKTPAQAARERVWISPQQPGQWSPVTRRFRDGHIQTWWVTDCRAGPYRIYGPLRLVVVTSDPASLPSVSTWYLATNLARPDLPGADASAFPPAETSEIVRLHGLRGWIEQDYKQVKHELGWADFQVRSDTAIRRHWILVNCAFSFCWTETNDRDPSSDQADPPAATPATASRPQWPANLRKVRAWLTPLHMLQRIWRGWSARPLPSELADLVNALSAGQRICLYLPP